MKTFWSDVRLKYDGSQLRSQFADTQFKISGDSIVAWRGACDVTLEFMVDGEDREAGAKICGDDMIHFIVEVSNFNLLGITALQRLFAAVAKDVVAALSPEKSLVVDLRREGDDLWFGRKKLSVSVATMSSVSAMMHFAVDVTNAGTPVPTISLDDFKIDSYEFARVLLERFQREFLGLYSASEKVSCVK
ncbi:MAG: hypothetical protein A4S09_05360 [Proteobacteria bacterium SG_bin7]|nr:MAG: hypothetical protein A4S09_05360 [Proteobacteria bacterium SG_bin7]